MHFFCRRKKLDASGQKIIGKPISWIGGWGVLVEHHNRTEQKETIDFDRITVVIKNKNFSGIYHIPFSFKGMILPQNRNSYIIPLSDLELPQGHYLLSVDFEKNKGEKENIQFGSILKTAVPEFVSPPEDYEIIRQVKESDVFRGDRKDGLKKIKEEVPLNAYYHCFSKNNDLFIGVRTEVPDNNKPFMGGDIFAWCKRRYASFE